MRKRLRQMGRTLNPKPRSIAKMEKYRAELDIAEGDILQLQQELPAELKIAAEIAAEQEAEEMAAIEERARKQQALAKRFDDVWERSSASRASLRSTAMKIARSLGLTRETTTSSGSAYYRDPSRSVIVRIADHEVPETDERCHNSKNGGFSWAHHGHNLVIDPLTTTMDVLRFFVDVRHELRSGNQGSAASDAARSAAQDARDAARATAWSAR